MRGGIHTSIHAKCRRGTSVLPRAMETLPPGKTCSALRSRAERSTKGGRGDGPRADNRHRRLSARPPPSRRCSEERNDCSFSCGVLRQRIQRPKNAAADLRHDGGDDGRQLLCGQRAEPAASAAERQRRHRNATGRWRWRQQLSNRPAAAATTLLSSVEKRGIVSGKQLQQPRPPAQAPAAAGRVSP
jgi:hypothetical protein